MKFIFYFIHLASLHPLPLPNTNTVCIGGCGGLFVVFAVGGGEGRGEARGGGSAIRLVQIVQHFLFHNVHKGFPFLYSQESYWEKTLFLEENIRGQVFHINYKQVLLCYAVSQDFHHYFSFKIQKIQSCLTQFNHTQRYPKGYFFNLIFERYNSLYIAINNNWFSVSNLVSGPLSVLCSTIYFV